jgi:hypothetical protein
MALGVPARVVRTLDEADRKMILELGLRYLENTTPGYRGAEAAPERRRGRRKE